MDNQLYIQRTLFKVSDLVAFKRHKSLILTPKFQRRSVWKPSAKSFFMDTVFRSLPVPIIFLRDRRPNLRTLELIREVIDGQQRIRTLFTYIDPKLLDDYNESTDSFEIRKIHNEDLAGKSFDELPTEYQNRILQYEFSVHILPFETSDREVIEIFRRLNSTGYKLNAQELRNAEFYGPFKTLMYKIAASQYDRWINWGVYNDNDIARMNEVQFVSDIAILMIQGISGGTKSTIDKFYRDFDETFPHEKEIKRRFEIVCDFLDDKIGKDISELQFSRKGLFYSLFAYIYDVVFGLESELKRIKPKSITKNDINKISKASDNIRSKNLPENVLEAVGRHSTHPGERTLIYKYIKGQ